MALPPEQHKSLLRREYHSDSIAGFLSSSTDKVLGALLRESRTVDGLQTASWQAQIEILRKALVPYELDIGSRVYFEWSVPRVGKRIDVVAVIRHVVFVIEFKVEATDFAGADRDQVWDYALDLKNFHETSHNVLVAPVLVATAAPSRPYVVGFTAHNDRLMLPICTNAADLAAVIAKVLGDRNGNGEPIDADTWDQGRYSPTPTIIEAALALYARHTVADIARSDASATNLSHTSAAVNRIVAEAREQRRHSICFVTGVPGAGKTLVGLSVATEHHDRADKCHSVFMSGNGPLVLILREALTRDQHAREVAAWIRSGKKVKKPRKGDCKSTVAAFIQNVHHFRDECLRDPGPPFEHVTIFDEAQRAWNLEQTKKFMRSKRERPDFKQSEPAFLIECMNRHQDWSVIVCLVGGGQEINTGEAGIGEWIEGIVSGFPAWHVHISPQLHESEYGAGEVLKRLDGRANVHMSTDLHLSVSRRSFRAERVSSFVKALLDREQQEAKKLYSEVAVRYPIMLTRDPLKAKAWLKDRARGSERYGLVVSSSAQRLKPHAIDVRVKPNPIHWFLGPKEDVRASYYLEDVATEFDVQGLELDWAGVVWDGDFRATPRAWSHHRFVGTGWQRVNKSERRHYLKNAYRVLLTRARQGMVIVVPEGDAGDPTRDASFYDPTFDYLRGVGLSVI